VSERRDLSPEERALLGFQGPTPEETAEIERIAAEKRDVRQKLLAGLMQNEDFRDWLWEILALFGAFSYPIASSPAGFPDSMATQFYLGRKSAGEDLWRLFDDLAPDLTSRMRREHSQKPAAAQPAAPAPAPPTRRPPQPPERIRLVGEGALPGEDDGGIIA